jgi:type II secretory pathway pseudopilin PulG
MRNKTMTLVELVIVIIIVSMLSVAAAGSFTQVSGRRFKNEVQLIVADIALARELAMTRHQAYFVNFNIVDDRYIVRNANCACSNANGCPATCGCCVMGEAGSGRHLTIKINSAPQIIFSAPLGAVTLSSAAKINLKRSSSSASPSANIVVSANTGYVYVE